MAKCFDRCTSRCVRAVRPHAERKGVGALSPEETQCVCVCVCHLLSFVFSSSSSSSTISRCSNRIDSRRKTKEGGGGSGRRE